MPDLSSRASAEFLARVRVYSLPGTTRVIVCLPFGAWERKSPSEPWTPGTEADDWNLYTLVDPRLRMGRCNRHQGR